MSVVTFHSTNATLVESQYCTKQGLPCDVKLDPFKQVGGRDDRIDHREHVTHGL
jgi:hypothetical protein